MRYRIARPDVLRLASRVAHRPDTGSRVGFDCRSKPRTAVRRRITRSHRSTASSRRRVRLGVIARNHPRHGPNQSTDTSPCERTLHHRPDSSASAGGLSPSVRRFFFRIGRLS